MTTDIKTREVTIKTTVPTDFMRGSFMVLPSYTLVLAKILMNDKETTPVIGLTGTRSKEEKLLEIENFWTGNVENIDNDGVYGLSNALNDLYYFKHGWKEPYYIFSSCFTDPFDRQMGFSKLSNLASCISKKKLKEEKLIELLVNFWWFVREPNWWKDYIFVYTDHEQGMKAGPREYEGKERPTTTLMFDYWIVALVKWNTEDFKKYKDWKKIYNPSVHIPKQCMEE